ncbi:MAG: S8/S53 family peptidase [Ferruginibacter sp.]
MKKHFLPLAILCFLSIATKAQMTRYIVKLKDKSFNSFSTSNPSQYLSARALQRRTRYNISIDSTDLPVTQRYIDSIRLAGAVTILNTSKWLNQVAIRTTDAAALAKINSFPFVISTQAIGLRPINEDTPVNKNLDAPEISTGIQGIQGPASPSGILGYYNYGKSNGQVKIHNGDFLHNHGFRGEGMHMAILDAGFYHYLTLPTFDSVRQQNRILGTWDFVANEASVDEDHTHGMQCFSLIAANIPGTFVGTAPNTSFYLYRTEDVATEYPIEEQNYAAGLERADSIGVDITSTSLGYSTFDNPALNYTYNDMNGNTTISAPAADFAAKKGMLNVIAAGNEGTSSWHFLITPSDADSVLSVGAVDTVGNVAGFSSYGPSSDGQVKPAVAAVGLNAWVANPGSGLPSLGSGTSFACPNMAGLTTCLWQAFPEKNNMTIINTLQLSASKASNPDTRVGYGIPDMKKAFVLLQKSTYMQQANLVNCNAEIRLSIKTDNSMKIIIERKGPGELNFSNIQQLQYNGSFSLQNLQYTDAIASAVDGPVKYRFKMEIGTDTTYYLDSASITLPLSCTQVASVNKIEIGPNPTRGDLNIVMSRIAATGMSIIIRNAAGQRVYKEDFQQPAGTRIKMLALNNLSKGVYFITVSANNEKWVTKKFIRN